MAHKYILLALGTNLGDRRENLRQAIGALSAQMVIGSLSPIYETPPWGISDQPDYLNMCLAATTTLSPLPLLAIIKKLETSLGRKPGLRWGPRLIDIDILFYDDLVLNHERLTIPHPRLAERVFVLAPLNDIAPQHRHPQSGRSVAQMLAAVDTGDVRKTSDTL